MHDEIQEIPEGLKYPVKLENYFRELLQKTTSAYKVARNARKKGYDPINHVEMEIANDIPSVVEAMIGPEGVAERIRELMEEGKETEIISIIIAKEIADGHFGQQGIEERANQAVKTALSISTGGITAAPLEGITKVEVREDQHLAINYAGPIRSAGGTETALSVLIADVVRKTLELKKYEIPKSVKERIMEEIVLYDRQRNLQFPVDKKKLEYVLEHVPVEINGEGSTEIKVSGPYRQVENVSTPRVRTGVALVVNDGIIGKASKLLRIISKLNVEGWNWLEELKKDKKGSKGEEGTSRSDAYMNDIVVGRPVFSFPSKRGGFRLRYGRARNTSLAALGIHPATMYLLNDFLATGTQIKTEKPGKAAVTMPVDSLMPPLVKLKNGDVIKVTGVKQAKEIKENVEDILFLGDLLSAVGEFFENNQKVFPSPIVEEWWGQELRSTIKEQGWDENELSTKELAKKARNDPEFALELTKRLNIPLHPRYTYFWRNVKGEDLKLLKKVIEESSDKSLSYNKKVKTILEKLFVPHELQDSKIKLKEKEITALKGTLAEINEPNWQGDNGLEILSSTLNIKDKYPVFVGARMGRPEKAKPRKLNPPIHVLLPMGKSGAKSRSITKAAKRGEKSKVKAWSKYCPECDQVTFRNKCPNCGKRTITVKVCRECGKKFMKRDFCPSCNIPLKSFKEYEIEFNKILNSGVENLGFSYPPEVKGVKGLTSKRKVPEPIEKGILRAKEGVYVFKDGTARFDATDLPLTHFKPEEINTSVKKLRELGYEEDVNGKKLKRKDQLLELKIQDIIVSEEGLEYLYDIGKFLNKLLTRFYGLSSYYDISEPKDLIGELVIGMAPHTSSGIIGRLIGTTKARGIYSHPYWHAAKRRNCFHPNTKIWIKDKNGTWKYEKIKDFVEEKLDPDTAKKDDFGTLFQKMEEDIYVPSINKQGKQIPKKIEFISKHRSTDHMLKISTQSGRMIKVTPDHSMVKWNHGEIEKLEAQDLSPGDKIPIPKEIQEESIIAEEKNNWLDKVKHIEVIKSDVEYTYSLTVEDTHTLVANDLYTGQCDGDEDAIILLLDGLINFSKLFLPESRGGKMDAPLVIRTILKPEVVDAEVFNIELCENLPLDFYRKSQETLDLETVSSLIEKIGDRLGDKAQFCDFPYNLSTRDINKGPVISSYKKLSNMEEKAEKQLETMIKISAVHTEVIASRILSDHLLPDVIGNLRAFGRQRFRCVQCNSKFPVWPLVKECPRCGGNVILTVSRGNITKYISLIEKIIEEYGVTDYIKSRYEILKRTDLKSLERVNRLGNAIKKAKKKRGKTRGEFKDPIKKEKEIKIEEYL